MRVTADRSSRYQCDEKNSRRSAPTKSANTTSGVSSAGCSIQAVSTNDGSERRITSRLDQLDASLRAVVNMAATGPQAQSTAATVRKHVVQLRCDRAERHWISPFRSRVHHVLQLRQEGPRAEAVHRAVRHGAHTARKRRARRKTRQARSRARTARTTRRSCDHGAGRADGASTTAKKLVTDARTDPTRVGSRWRGANKEKSPHSPSAKDERSGSSINVYENAGENRRHRSS